MAYRLITFVNNEIYHVYNRGVEKRQIFIAPSDYQRFILTCIYYQQLTPPIRYSLASDRKINTDKLVDILAYCLMPNHFHLLLMQLDDNGISQFISKVANSYTKFFNI